MSSLVRKGETRTMESLISALIVLLSLNPPSSGGVHADGTNVNDTKGG